MPIMIEVDESRNPLTTGTYEPDRVPQGFKAPDEFGRMRPNKYAGAKIGGGYDAPQGTPTWEPTWDQSSGITNPNLNGYKVWNAIHEGDSQGPSLEDLRWYDNAGWEYNKAQVNLNEPSARAAEWEQFNKLRGQGYDPLQFLTRPMMTDEGLTDYNEFGDQQWDLMGEIAPQMQAQSKWKQDYNMEITIDDLIQRPEFEGWTRDEIKGWLINQARASRGGIIGLL